MVDYVAIVLNGTCTGVGVIIAHKLWDTISNYHKKANNILKEVKNNVR